MHMAVGLKYSVPIVSYIPKELKRRASRVVERRKRRDPKFSFSQWIGELITEKVQEDGGEEVAARKPRQGVSRIST
jgi:hypothetical protein